MDEHPNSATGLVICVRVTKFSEVLTHSDLGNPQTCGKHLARYGETRACRDNTLIFTMLSLSFAQETQVERLLAPQTPRDRRILFRSALHKTQAQTVIASNYISERS